MKALIKVGYGCNDHCTFCHTFDVRHIDDTEQKVNRKIDRAAELGHSMVVLSGGEPTMRPELIRWATYTVKRGMSFGLVTNGRMLSYDPLLEKLLARRLEYVYLSLHGGTAKVHDANVRSEAFEQTFGGLKNCSGRGLDLTANCVVTRTNVEHLTALVDLVAPLSDVHLNFSMTEPKGGAIHMFEQVVPNMTRAAGLVHEAIEYGLEKGMRGRISHGGFPLCLMPGLDDAYSDLKSHGFATMTEVWEDDYFPVDDKNKIQPPACRDCALAGPCPGIYKAYEEKFGHDEIRPLIGRRSNSFNYSSFARLEWPNGTPCPIYGSGITPYDTGRSIFIRTEGQMRLYRGSTRDFSDVEIDETKRTLEQVYVDISDKTAPDNFATDLRKLTALDECRGCDAFETCARCYRIVDEDIFTRDDASIRDILSRLRGDVLDVGCGDGRYGDVLRPMAERDEIRYRGVEPDGHAAEQLLKAWPGANVEISPVEQCELPPHTYDHVLMLQSYNHLEDPSDAIRRLVTALKPGGTLLIADNVAFGLVRTQEQVSRAENGPAQFEHYRNHNADQARESANGLGLELLAENSVGPTTSNQWYLHYRRPTSAEN